LSTAYNATMAVSPARAAAFDILLRVERQASYASELLHSSAYAKLSPADHGLATELVMGVLRWRSRLDDEIAEASSQSFAKLDLEVVIALRLALYQLRWLARVPRRAAVHEGVELVKRARKQSAAAFVNAVLRKLSSSSTGDQSARREDSASALASQFAHPEWLVERWAKEYGITTVQKICEYDQTIPATTIRIRQRDAEQEFAAEGIRLLPGRLLSSARHVEGGDLTKTLASRKGKLAIQDEGSQLVAALVGGGGRILDCCAAPGGKTLAIADQNPEAAVTAVEIHPHRARLMRALLKGGAACRIQIVVADARSLPAAAGFDRVLADVPCSGSGTLARNPEIKWRLKPEDLQELHARQVDILTSAMSQLTSGGKLVYSTCSLEKEENEDVVRQALGGTNSFQQIDCRSELERLKRTGELVWPEPESLVRAGYLRTIPGIHPCDGFFAAILEKK
jgi:16S rRNA (cytosine967-C5)-methyltransferase